MRQIRPRNSPPVLAPKSDTTRLLVDLRDAPGAGSSERQLQAQLAQAKQAVREATRQLAILIDERDALRRRLDAAVPVAADPGDRSVVPWGFFDDELG
jgi:proline dehydrogenase